MKIKKVNPNMSVYSLVSENGDGTDWHCMWARITLDHDNYIMSAVSDCGNYSYKWCVTKSEPFMNLMCRINKSYLLEKVSSLSIFNLEKSKKETIKNLLEYCEDKEQLKNAIETINEIEDVSEDEFWREVYNIGWIDFESIEVVKEYPAGAKVFADLFIDFLQPELKKEIR